VKVIKSAINKYGKGDFYDLAFKKPSSKNKALRYNLESIPVLIVYNQDGEKLCRKYSDKYLPKKIDKDFIEANFKKCFEQYREDENGEKISELISYNLDELIDKTQLIFSQKDLKPNTYTIIFPWQIQITGPFNTKYHTAYKKHFKAIYNATKKENFNLIRLNRDIQKNWGFGDSLGIKAFYPKN
jgi:hypothetical protein